MLKHQAITDAYPSLETLTIEKGKGERADTFEKTCFYTLWSQWTSFKVTNP